MLKIKSAKISDFTDVNVRRVFGYAYNALREPNVSIHEYMSLRNALEEAERDLLWSNPSISLGELKSQPVWKLLQTILQQVDRTEHWTFNPDEGI